MSDNHDQQNDLRTRRNFLNLLKSVAVGFGAACVLGVRDADALNKVDPGVGFKSTGPVAKAQGTETGSAEANEGELIAVRDVKVDPDDPLTHMAQVRRRRRRRRWWPRRWRRRRRVIILR